MLRLTSSARSDVAVHQDSQAVITERVRGEFKEMPGLVLTLAQVRRLWSLDASTCNDVLSQLVEAGFLSRTADGGFCRASGMAARSRRLAKATIELVDIDEPRRRAQA
jgi:hypothetical protein